MKTIKSENDRLVALLKQHGINPSDECFAIEAKPITKKVEDKVSSTNTAKEETKPTAKSGRVITKIQ